MEHFLDLQHGTSGMLKSKVYSILLNKHRELDCFIIKHLKKGEDIVIPKSSIASPVFFVKKKKQSKLFLLYIVLDYCKSNQINIQNCYLFPLASYMGIFNTFNVCCSYYNIQIKEEDK